MLSLVPSAKTFDERTHIRDESLAIRYVRWPREEAYPAGYATLPALERSVSREILVFRRRGNRRSSVLCHFPGREKRISCGIRCFPRAGEEAYLAGYGLSAARETGKACCYASFPVGESRIPAGYASSPAGGRSISRGIRCSPRSREGAYPADPLSSIRRMEERDGERRNL
jgi:hypothetical protein